MGLTWTIPAFVPPVSPVPADTGTKDLFGYDILFRDGDLVKANGDYVRVGGVDNLRAAIYRRLITKPGEFRFRPTYGVGVASYVKKAQTQANLDALRTRIIDNLLQDKRINEVDVTIQSITLNGEYVLQVYVRVTALGNKLTFQPFTFAQEATTP